MFAIFASTGSSAGVTHTLSGCSARTMRRTTIACSSRSFAERSSCSPRWSSTAGSALRRVEPASASVPVRRPSRRTSSSGLAADEGVIAAADREDVALAERLAQHAEQRARVVRGGGVDLHLAREHDLVQRARADPLDGARDRMPRSARAASRSRRASVTAGSGSSSGSGAWTSSAARASSRSASACASSSGWTIAASVRRTSSPRRASATSGTWSEPGANPVQCGAAPPSGANANPPTATGPDPRGPSGGSASGVAPQRAPALGDRREAVRAGRLQGGHASERRQGGAVARRLLEDEPRLVRAARGDDDRRRVGVARRAATVNVVSTAALAPAARTAHRTVQPRLQALELGGAQRERPRRDDLDGHALQDTGAAIRSRRVRARSRSRRCASSRPGRTGGPSARTPRSCPSCPVTSMMIERRLTSTTLPRKISQICMTSARAVPSTASLNSASSRATVSSGSRSRILMTLTSLCSCLVTWSIGCSAPSIVMREAADRLVVRRPDGERVDVEPAPREQPGDPAQDAGLVLGEDRQRVLAPRPDVARGLQVVEAQDLVRLDHRSAHHVPRGLAGRDHRVHVLLAGDLHVDERRALGLERRPQVLLERVRVR